MTGKVPFYMGVNLPGVCRITLDVEDLRPLNEKAVAVIEIGDRIMEIIGHIVKEKEEAPKREREAKLLRENLSMIAGLS